MFEEIKKIERREIKNKKIEHICKNCRLFNSKDNICGVTIVREGEFYELQVLPTDKCAWEQWDIDIQQVRMWSDGKNGFIEAPSEVTF